MIIHYPYQTQQVRDLAWACFSPALLHVEQITNGSTGITGCALQLNPHRKEWLRHLDDDAAALLEYLSQRPTHRLGLYFEQLWHFFLQHDATTDLITHNLAVVDQGKTVGEFDCIYYDHQRERHVHLELAVKYFLGVPHGTVDSSRGQAQDWLGPDSRDRLDRKLATLVQRQALLGAHPAAAPSLHALGIGPLTREVVFKGYLFQPVRTPLPLPVGYNHACRMSHWVSCDQLQFYCASLGTRQFMILTKLRWLSLARCNSSGETVNAEQLHSAVLQLFKDSNYPIMIAAMDEKGRESMRFIVTPAHWPRDTLRNE